LPEAKFIDATEWVDEIKVPKSPEEIELIKGTAALQDQAIEHLKKAIKPGMREYEILAEAQYSCVRSGSERQLILLYSGQGVHTNYFSHTRHFQNRVIKEGDQVFILIETNGPGGYYTEIMKSFVLGKKPSQELQDLHGVSVEAQAITVSRLKPGADPKELWDLTNAFLKKKGYPENKRLLSHGQGLSLVERPLIRSNETWKLKAGMNITVHPRVGGKTTFDSTCENWIVGEDGPGACLHKTPREIIVIE
jgi:Xaa-Pro aminopeptidase